MLTAAERLLCAVAAGTLLAGVAGAASVSPSAEENAAPVVTVTVETPAPTTPTAAPRPTPRQTPRPAPKRTAAPRVDRPLAAAPPLTGCPPRPRTGGGTPRPLPPPTVAEAALPKPVPVRAKAAGLDAVRGKGLWATPLGTRPVDVAGLVAQARRTHVRSIWVRTGGTRQGYYGDRFLPQLVAAAHAHGVQVIAWDSRSCPTRWRTPTARSRPWRRASTGSPPTSRRSRRGPA